MSQITAVMTLEKLRTLFLQSYNVVDHNLHKNAMFTIHDIRIWTKTHTHFIHKEIRTQGDNIFLPFHLLKNFGKYVSNVSLCIIS